MQSCSFWVVLGLNLLGFSSECTWNTSSVLVIPSCAWIASTQIQLRLCLEYKLSFSWAWIDQNNFPIWTGLRFYSDPTQITSTSTWALLGMGLDSTHDPHNELARFYLVRCLSVNCWNAYSSLDSWSCPPVFWACSLQSCLQSCPPRPKTVQDRTLHHYESLSKMTDFNGKIVFGSGKCSVNTIGKESRLQSPKRCSQWW